MVAETGNALSAPALSQIESGRLRPSEVVVLHLASALDVPPGFFSAQWPVDSEPVTYFRDLRSTSIRERRRARAQAVLLGEFVSALEQHVRIPEVDVPACAVNPDATTSEIEDIAISVRTSLESRRRSHRARCTRVGAPRHRCRPTHTGDRGSRRRFPPELARVRSFFSPTTSPTTM